MNFNQKSRRCVGEKEKGSKNGQGVHPSVRVGVQGGTCMHAHRGTRVHTHTCTHTHEKYRKTVTIQQFSLNMKIPNIILSQVP